MQYKNRFLLGSAIFAVVIMVFASNSSAFNKFKSSEDEAKLRGEHMQLLRDIKKIESEILEQVKLTNKLLQKAGENQNGAAQATQ